jgi:hypothetical protein
MGRIRTIKPEFPHSETIGNLSRDARLLFIQLWTLVDDSGRSRASSRLLASLLYPFDDDAAGLMPGWLAELEAQGCLRLYQVDGGQYLEICKWLKHQKIDKPSASRLPGYSDSLANSREDSRSLAPDLGPRTLDLVPSNQPVDACPTRDSRVPDASGTRAQDEPEVTDPHFWVRLLSEECGNFDVRFQRERIEQIKALAAKRNIAAKEAAEFMVSQWQSYNSSRAKLNFPVSSAERFWTSGTWHDSDLWPWIKGQEPKSRRYVQETIQ